MADSAAGVEVLLMKRRLPSLMSTLETMKAGRPPAGASAGAGSAGFAGSPPPPRLFVLSPRAVWITVMAGDRSTT